MDILLNNSNKIYSGPSAKVYVDGKLVYDPIVTPYQLTPVVLGGDWPKYWLYLPPNYDATKIYPLVVYVPGRGSNGTDINLVVANAAPNPLSIIKAGKVPDNVIVVAPQTTKQPWGGQLGKFVDTVATKFKSTEITLAGISQGAIAALDYLKATDSAWGTPGRRAVKAVYAVAGNLKVSAEEATRIAARDVKLRCYAGSGDNEYGPLTKAYAEAVAKAGGDATFTEIAGAGHDSRAWGPLFESGIIYT